ncbi:limonene-1,2-epoxide hydrolase family protein [Aldersonia kunmingensis]|uniref:limonene-1,2-epoxide hydrolase family protein n=1 Tax=Aldersonia kunmingensis TaxID=408066 RepID=UPI00083058CD|nr:limonene-1,2-epoxide hydrolase family protein [Aldersonia kunmingensis]
MSEATELNVDAVSTVRNFLKLLELGDVDGAFALADPDIEWRNTGIPTIRGIDRVRKAFASMDRYNTFFAVDIHHIAGEGDVVLTERTDYMGKGKFKAGFWACGTFELRNGKVVLWHDHFSYADAIRGIAVGAIAALRSR